MHPRIMAERTQSAGDRILAATRVIAREYNLDAPEDALAAARHRDAAVSTLQEREAIAALLEGVVQAIEAGGDPDADLPIARFDDLKAAEVKPALQGRSREDLEEIRAYEETHRGRATVLRAIDQELAVVVEQERQQSEQQGPAKADPEQIGGHVTEPEKDAPTNPADGAPVDGRQPQAFGKTQTVGPLGRVE